MPALGLLAILGFVGFALASGGKKPAAPGAPGAVPGPGAATPPSNMPEDLKDKFAAALRVLTVDPVTGQVIGPVTSAAVQIATATAGELERAGFADAANTLRQYASIAAQMVAAPPPGSQIQIPGIPADLQTKLNTALQMERDPAKLRAIKTALLQLQPQGPEVVAAEGMLDALILQIETANATNTALQKVQQTIDQPKPTTFKPGVLTGTHSTIRLGSKGTDVATWQSFLGISVDGVFGPKTDASTRKFQSSKGLKADGVVGPLTWAAAQGGLAPAPTTPVVTPVVTPATAVVFTPGSLAGPHATIRLGSKGPDVATWQKFLRIPADGVFGRQTDAATRTFQRSKNLTADGIVGPATWNAAITGGAPSVVVPGPVTPTTAAYTPTPITAAHGTIRLGSKGADVATWQTFLGLKADGVFGPQTTAATRAFQKSHGLTPDGVVGPATWSAASGGAPAVMTPTPTAYTPGALTGSHSTIRLGSKGADVATWQQFLGIKADGIFGSGTDAATRKFQSSHGLKPDGVVGPQTWGVALSGGAAPAVVMPAPAVMPIPAAPPTAPAPIYTSTAPTAPTTHATIRQGSRGPDVVAWQKVIGVTADGAFGPQTAATTRAWQSQHGLTADGVVGPKTWAAAAASGAVVSGEMPPLVGAQPQIPTLRLGSRGREVAIWQHFLGMKQDGIFGPSTQVATMRFQQRYGIAPDGIVNPHTWNVAHRVSQMRRSPTHTVLRGETKESIAQHYTGNKDRWRELLTTNPRLTDVNRGIRLEEGHAIRLPFEWVRGPVGSAAQPALAESVPAPAMPVQPVDAPPVPQALPRPKTPLEIAASTMVKNLRAMQSRLGMPGAQRQEDRAFVARLQHLAGMSNPDGLAGPGTILTAARAGECTLPVVMYWPNGATGENVHQYRRVLQALAQKARSEGRHHQASELEASAAREHGQGGIVGSMVA